MSYHSHIKDYIDKYTNELSRMGYIRSKVNIDVAANKTIIYIYAPKNNIELTVKSFSDDLFLQTNQDAFDAIFDFLRQISIDPHYSMESQLIQHLKRQGFYDIRPMRISSRKTCVIAHRNKIKYSIIIGIEFDVFNPQISEKEFISQHTTAIDQTTQTSQGSISQPKYSRSNNSCQDVDFDNMDGHQFEVFCADILRKNKYENVTVTRGSGDQGIDIIAYRDGIKYGIQCKCYSSSIGNNAVQEVFAGKTFYQCHIGIVLTNNYFTRSASELATRSGVVLWDRDKLIELIHKADFLNNR